jgi:hypothetical protein
MKKLTLFLLLGLIILIIYLYNRSQVDNSDSENKTAETTETPKNTQDITRIRRNILPFDLKTHPLSLGISKFNATINATPDINFIQKSLSFFSTSSTSPRDTVIYYGKETKIYDYNKDWRSIAYYYDPITKIVENPSVNYIRNTPPPQFYSPGLLNTLPAYITDLAKNGEYVYRTPLMAQTLDSLYKNHKKPGAAIPSTNINFLDMNFINFLNPDSTLLYNRDFDGSELSTGQISLLNVMVYLYNITGSIYKYTNPFLNNGSELSYRQPYTWLISTGQPFPQTLEVLCNKLVNNYGCITPSLFYTQTLLLYFFLAFGDKLDDLIDTVFGKQYVTIDYVNSLVTDSNLENWFGGPVPGGYTESFNDKYFLIGYTQSFLISFIIFIQFIDLSFNINICEYNKPSRQGFQQFNYLNPINSSSSSNTFFTISSSSSSSLTFSLDSGYSLKSFSSSSSSSSSSSFSSFSSFSSSSSSSSNIFNPGPDVNIFKNIVIVYNGKDNGSGDNNVVINIDGTDSTGANLSRYSNPVAFAPDRSNFNYIVWIIPLNYPVTVNSFSASLNGENCTIEKYFLLFVNN